MAKVNSVRTHKKIATKASVSLRSKSTSNLTKKLAGAALVNRKRTSKK